MTQAESLADSLKGLFINPEAGWFTPISMAVRGLTAEQAASIPAERFNSVWGVVNHVRFWQEYMHLRLQGQVVKREVLGSRNGWPVTPENPTQEDWETAQMKMLKANDELSEFVRNLSDELLNAPVSAGRPSPYQVIQGLIAHNAYHTCEIISIRHMMGLWLERT